MHKFKIFGEIDSQFGYSTAQLDEQLKLAKGRDLFIDIDSIGGCLNTGIALFTNIRRYAKENNAHVTTRTAGFVASIATAPYLAGDTRIVNEFMQPFVHEPMFTWTDSVNADQFRKDAEDLDKTRSMIADFYQANTGMSREQALDLMANDTWISANECIALGFSTEIEKLSRNNAKIVASLKSKLTLNKNKMSKQKTSWFERLANIKRSAKAQLELAGVNGDPIVFPELEADAVPSVGDSVTVNGDAAYTGAAETDQYVLTVDAGVVSEIIDKAEIEDDELVQELIEIIEEKDAEIEQLQASLAKAKKLSNIIAGKDPEKKRNGKNEKPVSNSAQTAFHRIKNRKKK